MTPRRCGEPASCAIISSGQPVAHVFLVGIPAQVFEWQDDQHDLVVGHEPRRAIVSR